MVSLSIQGQREQGGLQEPRRSDIMVRMNPIEADIHDV